MNIASSKNAVIFIASLILMLSSSRANASCSRDDISFYLDKGFTTDQITVLCSSPSTKAGTPDSGGSQTKQQSNEQDFAMPVADDKILFLQQAIKAQQINLSRDALSYTQKICIEYGEEDLFGFTPKVCPEVKFIIALKGLEVLETGKKYYFYGTAEVRVKSTISREIIGNLKDQKPEDRELILEKFEQGDKTAIPIRDDFSLEQVKQVLQQLSI